MASTTVRAIGLPTQGSDGAAAEEVATSQPASPRLAASHEGKERGREREQGELGASDDALSIYPEVQALYESENEYR